jgi:2-isopropylmalate synthase
MQNDTRVSVFDTTLRDGEQARGAAMTLHDKSRIADMLDGMGIDVIEAGFPVSSAASFEAVRVVSSIAKNAAVCAIARATEADIDAATAALEHARRPRIHTFIATSPLHMREKLSMHEEEVLERIAWSVSYARRYVAEVEWTPEVATESAPAFLERAINTAVRAGASVVNVADTTGYMLPHEYGALVEQVVEMCSAYDGVVVSAHCHDDLGCAVANSLAALKAGARQVECTVNGIGERAGNAALEEVLVALTVRANALNLTHGVDLTKLHALSLLVAEASNTHVAHNKAVVGRNAFSHESGIHQDGVLKNPRLYEVVDPALVGRTRSITLGKLSGIAAVKHALHVLGFHPHEYDEHLLRSKFKELADRHERVDEQHLFSLVSLLRGSER